MALVPPESTLVPVPIAPPAFGRPPLPRASPVLGLPPASVVVIVPVHAPSESVIRLRAGANRNVLITKSLQQFDYGSEGYL